MNKGQLIYILDTTLRDGQQSPGAGMSFIDNLQYAEYAHLLKVDVLEAGFPAASKADAEIVYAISQMMAEKKSDMIIAALCQLREEQLIKTMEALKPRIHQKKARVHTYVPVDPALMKASLGSLAKNKKAIIQELYHLVSIAVREGFEVEFSPEGYSRMGDNFDFVTDLFRAAVEAGVHVINCPDTIGGAAPIEGDSYFVKRMQQHADIIAREFAEKKIIWSTHCHNDLGLALTNSINAVFDGPARQIEGCINGIGERAGNVSLEQCIIYIKQFGAKANSMYPCYTNTNIKHLKTISDFVAEKMLPRQPHSPIIGDNAARHTAGGHTNAIIKNPLAYQPFDPREIGSKITFVFGPLSGSNHARRVIEDYGYQCEENEKTTIAQSIKDYYADRRKGITDEELMEAYFYFRSPIKIDNISYKQQKQNTHLVLTGSFFQEEAMEIYYDAVETGLTILKEEIQNYLPIHILTSRCSKNSTSNKNFHSEIVIKVGDNTYKGEAVDNNHDIALFKAFFDAVNQAFIETYFRITPVKMKKHA